MVDGLHKGAWQRAKWDTIMIPTFNSIGFEYENFEWQVQQDWASNVIKILEKRSESYNFL